MEEPTGLHDLIKLTAEALHERAAYISEYAETIGVRYEAEPGRWQNMNLAVMLQRNPHKGLREAFRLLLRAEVPHRKLRVEETSP
jgi:hypothetical protein